MKYVRLQGDGDDTYQVALSNEEAATVVRAGFPAEAMRNVPWEGLGVESFPLFAANHLKWLLK